MLAVSRKLRIAVSAVLYIAYVGGDRPVRSPAITQRHGVPRRYLEPVMQQLVREGILLSERGPRGGYRLARERGSITVADIARCADALREPQERADDTPPRHDSEAAVLAPVWQELDATIIRHLQSITVQNLCDRAHAAGLESTQQETLDYTI